MNLTNVSRISAGKYSTALVIPFVQSISPFLRIQDINYPTTKSLVISNPPISSSGLPVTLSVKSGPATISGNVVTINGLGTIVLAANQTGNITYQSALEVVTSFQSVPLLGQTITFSAISPFVYGSVNQAGRTNEIILTNAFASSGFPVRYSSTNTNVIRINSNIVTILGAGTASVRADQDGNDSTSAAPPVTGIIVISKGSQTLTDFERSQAAIPAGDSLVINPPISSIGLPVNLSITSGPGTLTTNAGAVSLLTSASGTVTLAADQPGDSNFVAASRKTVSFTVKKKQSIPYFTQANLVYKPNTAITLKPPKASSGVSAVMSVFEGPATLGQGNKLSVNGAGTITLAADAPETSIYAAARRVKSYFIVAQAPQVIKPFSKIANRKLTQGKMKITPPTSSSGYPVVVTVKSGLATIDSDHFLSFSGPGTVTLAANQGGDTNYLPAKEVTVSFTVK
jgi:hypothetical protein